MEGEGIEKTRPAVSRRRIQLALTAAFLATLLAQPTIAFGWTNVVGIVITAFIGLVGLIIAWIVLAIVQLFNAFLVSVLFCALTLNPTFQAPGFTSTYATYCSLPAGGTPADGLISMIKLILGILYPMFAVALALTAAYLIFVASSPQHRMRAKQILTKLFIAMILASLAPPIYQLLLTIAGALTDGVLEVIDTKILSTTPPLKPPLDKCPAFMLTSIIGKLTCAFTVTDFPGTGTGSGWEQVAKALDMTKVLSAVVILTITAVFWMIAVMVVMSRYIIVTFLGILFPLTLAVYMFEFTRNAGRKMMKATLVFIFTPFLMSIWLAVGVALLPYASSTDNFFTSLLLLTLMSIMISVTPLQLSGLLAIIGGILTSIGQFVPGIAGTALTAIGGMMQGRGPAALAAGAMKFSGGKLLKGGKALLGAALFGGKGAVGGMLKKPFQALGAAARKGKAALGGAAGRGLMGGLVGTGAYKRAGRKVGGGAGKAVGAAAKAVKGAPGAAKRAAKGLWARSLPGRIARGLGAGVGAYKAARAAGLGKGRSLLAAVRKGVGRSVGGKRPASASRLGRALKFAAKVAVAKAVEKASFGMISGKDMFKDGAASFKGLGKSLTGVPGKAWEGIKGIGRGIGSAWSGAVAAMYSRGLSGAGASLGKLGWGGVGKAALKAVAGASLAGAALLGGPVGLAVAGAVVGARFGLPLVTKEGRKAAWGAAAAGARGVRRAGTAVKEASKQALKETKLGRAIEAVQKKGLGRAIGEKILGKQEYERYKDKVHGRGKFAGKPVGKKMALAGSLTRRAAQKALGLTDQQVKNLENKGTGASLKKSLETQRSNILDVVNGGKDVNSLTPGEKKRLERASGVDVDQSYVGGLNDSGRRDLNKKVNDYFDNFSGKIDKRYGLDTKIPDAKLANKDLMEDARASTADAEATREAAQFESGDARIAGIEKAEKEKAINPSGIKEDEARVLDKDFGIRTRGELANMDDNQRGAILKSGKIGGEMANVINQNGVGFDGLSNRDKRVLGNASGVDMAEPDWQDKAKTKISSLNDDEKKDLTSKSTGGLLTEMQNGAREGCERNPTRREQWDLDSGLTPGELSAKEKERDMELKQMVNSAGGRKPPMKEDFLTPIEEERE